MPTKKTKPTKKPRAKKSSTKQVKSRPAQSEGIILDTLNGLLGWVKHHILISLLAVVTIVALGWFGYTTLIKWQFSQAEKEVQNLSSAIIDKLGPPASTDTLKSCSYKSEKYAYGQVDAACNISMSFTYAVSDAEKASAISEKVNNVITSLYLLPNKPPASFEEGSLNSATTNSTIEYGYKGFKCWSSVTYDGYKTNPNESSSVNISIGCGKPVKYYRIYPEV